MGDRTGEMTSSLRGSHAEWTARRNFKRLSLPLKLTESEANLRRTSNRPSLSPTTVAEPQEDDIWTVDSDPNGGGGATYSSFMGGRKGTLSSLRSLRLDNEGKSEREPVRVSLDSDRNNDRRAGRGAVSNSVVIKKLATRREHSLESSSSSSSSAAENIKQCTSGGGLLGAMYACVLALLGTALPLREALTKKWLTDYIHAVFLVFVYGVGLIFLVGLEIYLIRAARQRTEQPRPGQQQMPSTPVIRKLPKVSGAGTPQTPATPINRGLFNLAFEVDQSRRPSREHFAASPAVRPVWCKRHMSLSDLRQLSVVSEHSDGAYIIEPDAHWNFPLPHHTSLYLRIGITLFGLATIVYDCLLIIQLHEQSSPSSCHEETLIWPHYVHLAFLLMQTFFIFKHPQIQVMWGRPVVRIGFMHLLATNWCFWMRTLIRETLDNVMHHNWLLELETMSMNVTFNLSSDTSTITECDYEESVLYKALPYLFPCVLEYSLLAGAAIYSMHSAISFQLKDIVGENDELNPDIYEKSASVPKKQYHLIEISFHRTHRGVFLGILVVAATIVSTILCFSYLNMSDDEDNKNASDDEETALLIYSITDTAILTLLALVTALAWIQMNKLTYFHFMRGIMLDEILMFTGMGGLVLFHVLRVMPVIDDIIDNDEVDRHAILLVCECILSVVGVIFQTAFIVDGVCRYVTTRKSWENKPGRASLTFLLCTNLAMWILRSFQLKQTEISSDLQVKDYGHVSWTLIQYICVPLLIFYFYHCSACIAHIWSCAYTKDLVKDDDVAIPPELTAQDFAGKGFIADSSWTHIDLEREPDQEHVVNRRVIHRSSVDVVRMKSPVSEV